MKTIGFFFAITWGIGCSLPMNNEESSAVRDVRVAQQPPDPAYVDIYTPDGIIIQPGEDKIYCYHTTYDGDDTGVRMFDAFQGKFGHHLLLMTTTEPLPPGTVEDCSSGEELRYLQPIMYPTIAMPDNGGIWLKHGMPLVLHFHYANTSTQPILVRDLARLEKIDPNEVERWIAPMALASFDFALAPFADGSVSFDCDVPRDLDLILVSPHMHELGKDFSLSYMEPGAAPVSLIAEQWEDKYRWAPNMKFLYDNPRRLTQSSVLRVECTWSNHTPETVTFPVEMCAAFGYIQDADPMVAATPGWDDRVFFCKDGSQ